MLVVSACAAVPLRLGKLQLKTLTGPTKEPTKECKQIAAALEENRRTKERLRREMCEDIAKQKE